MLHNHFVCCNKLIDLDTSLSETEEQIWEAISQCRPLKLRIPPKPSFETLSH